MCLSRQFTNHVAHFSIGGVSVNGCTDKFIAGSKTIPLENHEIAIIHSLMTSNSGLKKSEIMAATSIPTTSLFDQIFEQLMNKLRKIDIANYGGNGSYYNQTILAQDLFEIKDGLYSFNSPLGKLIGTAPILSDAELNSIQFQSHDYSGLSF